MIDFRRIYTLKILAVALSALLLAAPARGFYPEGSAVQGTGTGFEAALNAYQKGFYKQAAAKLAPLINAKEAGDPEFKAKVYLLLAACYEKLENRDKARGHYLALKGLLDNGLIDRLPVLPGIDTGVLSGYREVFEESYFKFKKPIDAAEMRKKNMVHAPRKSIAVKEKERKRKKFPWLIAIGVAVAAGVTVLLLTKKKKSLNIPRIEWVKIPAGEFLMGDNFKEGDNDELPVHKVYLDEYYISKYEINRLDYMAFCDATGRQFLYERLRPYGIGKRAMVPVSRSDAVAFCEWLSLVTGENINLPTEAQWEKAARGTYQYRYPWGNDPPDSTRAQYGEEKGLPTIVGSFPAGISPYGIHDMAGNAAEWCRDRYHASYYAVSPAENPTGADTGNLYVVRGGSARSDASGIRCTDRDFRVPGDAGSVMGFRIVKEVPD